MPQSSRKLRGHHDPLVRAALVRPRGGGSGTVTDVTGTSPVHVANGTTAPVVSLAVADGSILIGQAGGGSPAAHPVSGDATLSDAGALTLATVNPDVGTFGDGTHVSQVTVDGKGRVTAVANVAITTGGGGTVTDVTGTAPVVVANGTTTPAVSLAVADGSILIGQAGGGSPAAHPVSGDATLSDAGALTLATVNPDVGTFGDGTHVSQVTVDGKGRVTAVANVAITTGGGGTVTDVTGTAPVVVANGTTTPAVSLAVADGSILIGQAGGGSPAAHPVSGDATLSDAGALTLATVNPDVGTFGDGTHVSQVTVDGKGRVTAVANVAITTGGGGTVTDVTGTAPVVVANGTTTPAVSLAVADGSILIGQAGGGSPAAHPVSGDATLSDAGVLTLDTVNANVGTVGDATHVAQVTLNGKGLATAAAAVAITFPVASVTATAPILNVGSSSAPDLALVAPTQFWQTNAAPISLTNTPQTVATVTLTPSVSGRFFVTVDAQVENTDSSNVREIIWEIVNTHDANTYSPVPTMVPIGLAGTPFIAAAGFNVALDQTAAPSVFPLATNVTLTLRAAADAASGLTLLAGALQVNWQERYG